MAQCLASLHGFGGTEFRFGISQVGDVYTEGIVELLLSARCGTRSWRKGFAEEHGWLPNSGWTAFVVRKSAEHLVLKQIPPRILRPD